MARSLAACPHRPPCPGCPRYVAFGVAPEALRPLQALAARAGLPDPRVISGSPSGFRHRARLAVRGRMANPKIGIFEAGTHRVVAIPDCRVHHPLINSVAKTVRRALVVHAVPPYSDLPHAGRARSLQVVVERSSERAQVVLVTNDISPRGLEPLFAGLVESLGERLQGLWWNGNAERTNAILGPHWEHIAGAETVIESFEGVRIHYPPGAFGQSNLPLAAELVRRVSELVPAGQSVLELYAGTGALGLPLAERAARLELNEIGEHSLDGLKRSIAELSPEIAERIRVHPGPAESALARIAAADVVIVDPPRKGLGSAVLAALLDSPPERLVYVSCGLEAFLVEANALLASGKFALTLLEAYALFPFTEHVETLAVFEHRPCHSNEQTYSAMPPATAMSNPD